MRSRERAATSILTCAFFVSGATALASEVVFNRLLAYIFGSSHKATATVLAAYMCGLSVGAIVFGRMSSRWRRPVVLYGVLELSVAAFLASVPRSFALWRDLAVYLTRGWAEQPAALTIVEFVLSFLFVLLPTLFMGGTLPALIASFARPEALGRRLPLLYAVNTLGAATGTLVAAYASIPRLGLDGTLYAAATIDVGVAFAAFAAAPLLESMRSSSAAEPAPAQGLHAGWSPRVVCGLAFSQGAIAFSLEVVWFHLVGTVIGVTVYAFSIMLAAILLGIGLGSLLSHRLLRRHGWESPALFVWAELTLAAGVLASLYVWDRFPDVITISLALKPQWTFAEREAVRFLFALLLLIVPALALGAGLPSLTASVRPGRRGEYPAGAWVGLVFGANTLGAIAGSIFCGFVLLGQVASERILLGIAAVALTMAVGARLLVLVDPAVESPALFSRRAFAVSLGACLLAAVAFPGWRQDRLTAGSHYYWQAWHPEQVPTHRLFVAEDAQSGFISVEEFPDGLRFLKTNGKYEGSSQGIEFQDHLALLGGLYARNFARAALVGLGPGRTLARLHAMPFRHLDVIEYSPGILHAAERHFPEFVRAPFADPRVRVVCDDGRGFLQLASPGYDLVVIAISGAAFAGVGNFYTYDFFRIIRSQLSERGIFLLWLQIHHVRAQELRSVLFTLRQAFPNVHLYALPDQTQAFLIASAAPLAIDPGMASALSARDGIHPTLAAYGMESLLELTALAVFTTGDEMEAYLKADDGDRPVLYTDWNPGFEYAAPYGLALPGGGFNFRRFSAGLLPSFSPPLEEGDAAGLMGLRLRVAGRDREALEWFRRSERLLGRPAWAGEIATLEHRGAGR